MIKRFLNILREKKIYQFLKSFKKIPLIKKLKNTIEETFFPPTYRLHGDIMLREAFNLLAKEMNATSIVETGTFLGLSTSLIAETNPNLNVYSCEISKKYYLRAKKKLKKLRNVHLYLGESPKFLNLLIEKNLLGERPLFFLDAHWGSNWPLEKEMEIISQKLKQSIILIDDFKVPDDKRFRFDAYGTKECSLDRINPNISKKNKYNLFFPNYNPGECFKKDLSHSELTGYPIIFQNMSSLFKKLKHNAFIKKYFVDKSYLLKPIK